MNIPDCIILSSTIQSKVQDLLSNLYSHISQTHNLHPLAFYLTSKGKILQTQNKLSDYNFREDTFIEINYRCLGGMQPPSLQTIDSSRPKKLEKRSSTLKEFVRRIHKTLGMDGEGSFEEQMEKLKYELDTSINREGEKFWDVIGIENFNTPIKRITTCSTDKDRIIIAEKSNTVHYYSIKKRKILKSFILPLLNNDEINQLVLSHHDKYLIIGTHLGNIHIYNRKKRDLIHIISSENLSVKKIRMMATIKITRENSNSDTMAYPTTQRYYDDENEELLQQSILENDEYLLILDNDRKIAFVNLLNKTENPAIAKDLNQQNHIIRFTVNPTHTHMKCFLDDGRVYDIEFKKDEEKDTISIYDREVKQSKERIWLKKDIKPSNEASSHQLSKKLEQESYEQRLHIVFESLKHKLLGTGTKVLMTANRDKNDAYSIIGLEVREDDDKLFHFSMLRSQHIEVIAGTEIFASRYDKELAIIKSRDKIDSIFDTNDKIDPNLSSKENTKRIIRQKRALANIDSCARCIAISTSNQRAYSGWEDGKILVVNYMFRRIIREIPRPKEEVEPQNFTDSKIEDDNREDVLRSNAGKESMKKEVIGDIFDVYSSESDDYDDEDEDWPENDVLINHRQNESESDLDFDLTDKISDRSIEENSLEVTALALYENYLIAGYSNGQIIAYNQDNFKEEVIFRDPDTENSILCLEVLQNHNNLLVRTKERFISFNLDIDYNINKLTAYEEESLEFRFDKKMNPRLAASGRMAFFTISNNTAVLVNIDDLSSYKDESKDLLRIELSNNNKITGLSISEDLKKLGIVTSDCDIFKYEIVSNSGKLQTKLLFHHNLKAIHEEKQFIIDMKMTHDGLMIFGLQLGGVRIIDIETLEEIANFERKYFARSAVASMALSADDEFILVNSKDWSQKLIALNKKRQHAAFNIDSEEKDHVDGIAILKKSPNIAVASCFNTISFFNINTKKKVAFKVDDETSCKISSLQITDDTLYLSFSSKGIIRKCDLRKIKEKDLNFTNFAHIKDKDDTESDEIPIIKCMRLSCDNAFLICSLDSRSIKVYHRINGEKYHVFTNLEDEAEDLVIHPTKSEIFMTAIEKNIYVFNLKLKSVKQILYNFHSQKILKVSFSKKGEYFATACEDLKIKISEYESHQPYFTFDESQLLKLINSSKEPALTCLAFAGEDRFLIYAGNKILKIQNVETKSLVYSFSIKENIKGMTISDNSQYLICGNDEAKLFVYNMPIFVDESHTIPYSDIISPYVRIGTLNQLDTINNETSEKKSNQVAKHKNLHFWPHNWCILHFFAIRSPERLEAIPSYSEMKIRWVVDSYGRTPLHYLLGASFREDNINYTAVNRVFDYILDFLEDNINNKLTFYETMKSLSNISTFMFAKCHAESLHRYLKMAFTTPNTLNFELPRFGVPGKKMILQETPTMNEKHLEELYRVGSRSINFRMVLLYYDFHPLSEDMLSLILVLQKIGDQNFFKTRTISTLVDYLWRSNLKFNYAIAICFSFLVILAAIDLTMDDPPLWLQIIIFILDGLFILHECIQMSSYGLSYYCKSIWNYFDMTFYILLIAALIIQINGGQNNLGASWIFSFVFLTGFGRWITYLRLFDLSRNLIRTILDIMMNMWGFIIIICAIILGFCLTFYVFDKSYYFSDYLLSTYFMLYGNNNLENASTSQEVLAVSVTFMLGVFFLNMLVSIMNDSFNDSQRLKVIKDAKERLDIVYESTNVMRLFTKTREERRGYLVFCEKELDNNMDDEVDPKDLTDNINFLKKTIHKSEGRITSKLEKKDNGLQSRLKDIEDKFNKMDENMSKIRNEKDGEIQRRLDTFDEKFNTLTQTLDELKNMISTNNQQNNDSNQKSQEFYD